MATPSQEGTHLTVSSVQCVVVDFGHGNEVAPPIELCVNASRRVAIAEKGEGRHSQSSCR